LDLIWQHPGLIILPLGFIHGEIRLTGLPIGLTRLPIGLIGLPIGLFGRVF
jgi:hypothetical protein